MATFAFGSAAMFDGNTIAIVWNPTGASAQGTLSHTSNLTVTVSGTPQTATFVGFLFLTNNIFATQYTIGTAATQGQSVTLTASAAMVTSSNGNTSEALSAVVVENDVVDAPVTTLVGYVTLASFKEVLGITVTTYDTMLTNILTRAAALIDDDLNRNIVAATYAEMYDGNDEEALVLNQAPIQNVLSVSLVSPDGSVAAVDSTSYAIDASAGVLNRVVSDSFNEIVPGGALSGIGVGAVYGGGWTLGRGRTASWPPGKSNIAIVYQAGYLTSAIPQALKQEALDTATDLFLRTPTGLSVVSSLVMSSQKTEGYEYTKGSGALFGNAITKEYRDRVRSGNRRWSGR